MLYYVVYSAKFFSGEGRFLPLRRNKNQPPPLFTQNHALFFKFTRLNKSSTKK